MFDCCLPTYIWSLWNLSSQIRKRLWVPSDSRHYRQMWCHAAVQPVRTGKKTLTDDDEFAVEDAHCSQRTKCTCEWHLHTPHDVDRTVQCDIRENLQCNQISNFNPYVCADQTAFPSPNGSWPAQLCTFAQHTHIYFHQANILIFQKWNKK